MKNKQNTTINDLKWKLADRIHRAMVNPDAIGEFFAYRDREYVVRYDVNTKRLAVYEITLRQYDELVIAFEEANTMQVLSDVVTRVCNRIG